MIFPIFLLDSNGGYSLIYIYVLKLIENKINEGIKYMVIYKKRKKEKKGGTKRLGAQALATLQDMWLSSTWVPRRPLGEDK